MHYIGNIKEYTKAVAFVPSSQVSIFICHGLCLTSEFQRAIVIDTHHDIFMTCIIKYRTDITCIINTQYCYNIH